MRRISINYTIKFALSFSPKYKWLEGNICFNEKTGRIIKQTICGGSIGYVIDGKFKSLTYLRNYLIRQK